MASRSERICLAVAASCGEGEEGCSAASAAGVASKGISTPKPSRTEAAGREAILSDTRSFLVLGNAWGSFARMDIPEQLIATLRAARHVMVLTGAGVS